MFTTDYNCYVLKKSGSYMVAAFGSISIISFIAYLVLFIKKDRLAQNMEGLDNYCLMVALAALVLAVAVYFLKRFKVSIEGDNKRLSITVNDPSLTAPLVINYPFTTQMYWHEVATGSRAKMKKLYLTISDVRNEPLITFTGALGAAYDAPKNFIYVNMFDRSNHGTIKLAETNYDTGKILDIADNLNIHVNYLVRSKDVSDKKLNR